MLRKPERQRNPQISFLSGIADELHSVVPFADHFSKLSATAARQLLPHEQKVGIKRINGGSTDDNSRALDERVPDVVGPMRPWSLQIADLTRAVPSRILATVESGTGAVILSLPAAFSDLEHVSGVFLACDRVAIVGKLFVHEVIGSFAWLARIAAARELLRRDVSITARISRCVASSDTGELADYVHPINQISVSVQRYLTFCSELNAGVERLSNRL